MNIIHEGSLMKGSCMSSLLVQGNTNINGNITLGNSLSTINILSKIISKIPEYYDNATAKLNNIPIGGLYRTGGILKIRVDDISPVLTLIGSSNISISTGPYVDPGVTASDNISTNLTVYASSIKNGTTELLTSPILLSNISSYLNFSPNNTYVITYTTTDNDGNQAIPIYRTVSISAAIILPLTNKIGIYVPSTGATSVWSDLYSSGYNFNVDSSMTYQGNYFYKNTSRDLSLKANFSTAVINTIKTIIVVMNWGTTGVQDWTIVNDCPGGGKFISPRNNGSFLNIGSGSPTIYFNNVNVTSGFTPSNLYSNTWITVVISNIDCTGYTGFEIAAYTSAVQYAMPIGGKIAAIALFTSIFSPTDVAVATTWGQSFYSV
jgi:hypothetical protein